MNAVAFIREQMQQALDLPQFRGYAAAIAASTDEWLSTLRDEDLDRAFDFSAFGFGGRTRGCVVGAGVLGHVQSYWGELSALKGMQGGKGFPV